MPSDTERSGKFRKEVRSDPIKHEEYRKRDRERKRKKLTRRQPWLKVKNPAKRKRKNKEKKTSSKKMTEEFGKEWRKKQMAHSRARKVWEQQLKKWGEVSLKKMKGKRKFYLKLLTHCLWEKEELFLSHLMQQWKQGKVKRVEVDLMPSLKNIWSQWKIFIMI